MSNPNPDITEAPPACHSHIPRVWLLATIWIALLLTISAFVAGRWLSQRSENVAPTHETKAIANYRADFQPQRPKTGWHYYWNANGPVGDTNSYVELVWNGTLYATAAAPLPAPSPARYLRLSGTGGHPGQGPSQTTASGLHYEHAAIVAFTVPQAGGYVIERSFISRHAGPKSGAVRLQIFVDDRTIEGEIFCRSRRNGEVFDRDLGRLSAGDTIYVVVGPDETDQDDSFDLNFTIGRY